MNQVENPGVAEVSYQRGNGQRCSNRTSFPPDSHLMIAVGQATTIAGKVFLQNNLFNKTVLTVRDLTGRLTCNRCLQ